MILIIGGAFQGKLEFAIKRFKLEQNQIFCIGDNESWEQFLERAAKAKKQLLGRPVLIQGFHELTRRIYDSGSDVEGAVLALGPLLENAIVISNDVSCGLVPMNRDDRLWREAHGRALGHLSSKAREVYRVFCGIAIKIKGDGVLNIGALSADENCQKKDELAYIFEGSERWKLVLIRHGQTIGNVNKWYYGSSDLELTEDGRKMLEVQREKEVYKRLRFEATHFFHTGLKRTKETCEILFGNVDAKVLPLLKEIDFGQCECLTYDEACRVKGFKEWVFDENGDVTLPSGESKNTFIQRVRLGTSQIIDGGFGTQVIICHGGVIGNIMAWLFPDEKRDFWQWIPQPGSGFIVDFDGRKAVAFEEI